MSFIIAAKGSELPLENLAITVNASGGVLNLKTPAVISLDEDAGFVSTHLTVPIIREAQKRDDTIFERAFGMSQELVDSIEIEIAITASKVPDSENWFVSAADVAYLIGDREGAADFARNRRQLAVNTLKNNTHVSLSISV